jgi:GNAT superfamily N-acetyltransferase
MKSLDEQLEPTRAARAAYNVAVSERTIKIAESDDEIAHCYSVMSELRPHLTPAAFVDVVRALEKSAGLHLVYLTDAEAIKAVAGIRIGDWLAGGRYLEIEDLATTSGERSKGYGAELFDWIVAYARQHACRQIRLVSRTTRTDAHRFYERRGMQLEAYYFSMNL